MALEVTTNRQDFLGNGVTTVWSLQYKFWEPTEIECTKVLLDGTEVPLVYNVDFTVQGGGGKTGTVTIDPPIPGDGTQPNSERLITRRLLPIEQTTRLKNQGPYFPEAVEEELDKTNARIQQLSEELSRAIRQALSGEGDTTFPTYSSQAIIGWDISEQKLRNWTVGELGAIQLTTWGQDWILKNDSLEGRNTLDTRRMAYFDGVPGINQDSTQGYAPLDQLVDQNTNILYSCSDATPGSAVWVLFPWGGGGGGGGAGAYVGEVRNFGAGAVPLISEGWLPQDGRFLDSVANPEYAALYSKIGTTYGGTGPDNFSVGDARGRSSMGAGQGSGLTLRNAGEALGAETHQLTEAELPSHNHSFSGESNRTGDGSGTGTFWRGTATRTTNNTGSDQPHPNVHPVLVGNFGICYDPALSPQLRRFTDLIDTPATYAGAAKKPVTVNDGESGLTFGLRDAQTIESLGTSSLTFNSSSSGVGAIIADPLTTGGGLVIAGGDGTIPNGRPLSLVGYGNNGAGFSLDIDGTNGLLLAASAGDVTIQAGSSLSVAPPAVFLDSLSVSPAAGVADMLAFSADAGASTSLFPGDGTADTRAFDWFASAGKMTGRALLDSGTLVRDVLALYHDGNVDVPNGELREGGQRVYSPNNPPPAGSNTFLGLTDVFAATYVGQSGRFAAVRGTEDGLELVDPPTGSGDVTITGNTNNDEIMLGAAAAKGIKNSGSFLSDFATAGHTHPIATVIAEGFMSPAQVTSLNATLRTNADNAVQKAAAQGQLNFDLLSPDASVDLRIRPGLGTADQRAFDLLSNGTALQLRAVNDAFSVIARTVLDMTWADGNVNVSSGKLLEGTIPVVLPTDRTVAATNPTLDFVGSPVVVLSAATAITPNAPTSGQGTLEVTVLNDVGCTPTGFTKVRGSIPSGTHKLAYVRRYSNGDTLWVWGTD